MIFEIRERLQVVAVMCNYFLSSQYKNLYQLLAIGYNKHMSQQVDTEQMIQTLESFLERFNDYANEIFVNHDRVRLRQLRSQLQRESPRVTEIIVTVIGNSHFRLGHVGTVSMQDLITTALLGGNNEMSFNFRDFNATVTAAIERAIGTLVAGLWPPKTPNPVLVIHDEELRQRCSDLLGAPGNFDRVVREATTVLEDRIRQRPPFQVLAKVIPNSGEQTGDNLINKLFNPDNPVLSRSSDKLGRVAFRNILVGVVSYLRNPYHHKLDDNTEWSWAWSTVGLIDQLLLDIEDCTLQET